METHIPAHVNIDCPQGMNSKLTIYISELILDRYKHIPVAHLKIHCILLR
jgi:hypothetical protein